MYIGFRSEAIAANQITDYLIRVVQPKLQAVQGVQTAELLGSKTFAMRAWLDPIRLAAYGVTATEVSNALTRNDYIASLGSTKGQMVQVNLTASTSLHNVDEFKNLIVKESNGAVVRLKDVANVTLGADDYDSATMFNGRESVYIGIQIAPAANLLDVIKGVRAALPDIERQLPTGLAMGVIYDSSAFVNSSIEEVIHTLVEALVIVTLVVFAFLGSWRSVLIPVIAIPLSLIGTFLMMLAFGFSINLLTLLALVLAIGLVVDDAIIVVESVNHHMEEGMSALQAAFASARQLASPIIAMTVVLIAVYVPIGFQGGLTGALFTEFAFTLVGAVTISAVVALTLTPMMSAYMLKPVDHAGGDLESRMVLAVDRVMGAVTAAYSRSLRGALNSMPVTAVFAGLVLCSIYWLYGTAQSELAPEEDQGIILAQSISAPNATLQQKLLYNRQTYDTFAKHPETETVFQVESTGTSIAGWVLKPWDERKATTKTLQPMIQQELNAIAGQKIVAFQTSPLPGSNGLPMQVVIGTSDGFDKLNEVAAKFLQEALDTGLFIFLNNDLKIDQPQASIVIDREKTSLLGLSMSDVGGALSSLLGGGYVNYFSLDGRSYKVIPQVKQEARLNTDQVLDYYMRLSDGTMVPLSTVARIETRTVPESLNHFQQVNAATISGVVAPGVTTGDAIAALQDLAQRTLPAGYTLDFGGASRQYVQESGGFVTTFAFALIVIFLSLAALFNSFRDPVVILLSVPMSLAGALLFISLGVGGASINIYTQVGLTTLMGLISKHGILMLEVANELQLEGKSKREAIIAAATLRLRPILMTTAAMVLGVVPLIFASGAGAASRFNLGLVIATGLAIGTLFTLYVVPTAYVLMGQTHRNGAAEAVPESAPAQQAGM
jgi:multidrug efflux pump